MKEKQNQVQPESDIRTSQQETSKSSRRTKEPEFRSVSVRAQRSWTMINIMEWRISYRDCGQRWGKEGSENGSWRFGEKPWFWRMSQSSQEILKGHSPSSSVGWETEGGSLARHGHHFCVSTAAHLVAGPALPLSRRAGRWEGQECTVKRHFSPPHSTMAFRTFRF